MTELGVYAARGHQDNTDYDLFVTEVILPGQGKVTSPSVMVKATARNGNGMLLDEQSFDDLYVKVSRSWGQGI